MNRFLLRFLGAAMLCGVISFTACAGSEAKAKPREKAILATTTTSKTSKESQMMVIRVQMKIKKENDAAFRTYMKEEVLAVRKLPGCEKYALYQSTHEDHYLLYEEWSSAEDFAAFQKSDRLKKSFAVLGPMMAGAPDSAYFSATKAP